jgi:hypothetical protein
LAALLLLLSGRDDEDHAFVFRLQFVFADCGADFVNQFRP